MLIKNSKFIEELTEIDTVVFDKTGTVTKGELTLTEVHPFAGDEEALLKKAASLAAASNHPVSRAVVAAMVADFEKAAEVHEISGGGMESTLPDGTVLRFGRRQWLESLGCTGPAEPEGLSGSVSYVAENENIVGCLCFNDTVRENAAESIEKLRKLDVQQTVMLTGDREEPAEEIRRSLGIDTLHARLLPEDKLKRLQAITEENHRVLVVGDGINDALILRQADVGIAMGAMGSDLAIESADIALMNNNLMNIPFAVSLARRTRRVIYQNLVLSVGISVTMIALSAFGVISALAGSILHNFGAFAVLLNSSKLLREE